MTDEAEAPQLNRWKRAQPGRPAAAAGTPVPLDADFMSSLRCGGPEYTLSERFELMRQRQREMDEQLAREEQERSERADAKRRGASFGGDDDEADDEAPAKPRRDDRYSVGLLRNNSAAWDSGAGAGSGQLG
ncbi:hypothetical protein Athai_31410 [Actinocatenispora thailandica]|uniref:Uncharacterized protein n=1 Tax=Actinocatenispora thailandica TaxID=227318 RepID=A0A7R7DPX3_9ACTN|nr:hypothetical protein [Actinocatenispora thailandica]BCJ35638.1 hypothetical protein Athai_31410 [Actinocatenispora thailandica]